MPHSDRFSLAKNSCSKWIPYNIHSRSQYVLAGQLAVLQTPHLHDPMIITGVSTSTGADHDIDEEDCIVHQLVDRILIPDHPRCQELHDLVAGTICVSLASYQTQIAIFNTLLSEGTPSSSGGGADSSGSD
ncbi:hypothetical protein EDD16DRAFT_1708895 [Pisolithus croceorrhizus]|nr:hypothetical protein EDD16DRAFT_1708895 [Pisolithus croceorrhizus]